MAIRHLSPRPEEEIDVRIAPIKKELEERNWREYAYNQTNLLIEEKLEEINFAQGETCLRIVISLVLTNRPRFYDLLPTYLKNKSNFNKVGFKKVDFVIDNKLYNTLFGSAFRGIFSNKKEAPAYKFMQAVNAMMKRYDKNLPRYGLRGKVWHIAANYYIEEYSFTMHRISQDLIQYFKKNYAYFDKD